MRAFFVKSQKKSYDKQAVIHGKKIIQKEVQNLTDGHDLRNGIFHDLHRYSEICFITKPCQNYIELIIKILKTKYKFRIHSGINQAGIAIFPLKSTRCVVVIFMAFFKPIIEESLMNEFFSSLPEGNLFSEEDIIKTINEYRDFIKFPKLEPKALTLSSDSILIKRITTASSPRKLLKKWLQDSMLMDFLNELWTSFAIERKTIKEDELTYSFGFVGHGVSYQIILNIHIPEEKLDLIQSPFTYNPVTPSMKRDNGLSPQQMTKKEFSTPKICKSNNNNPITPVHDPTYNNSIYL